MYAIDKKYTILFLMIVILESLMSLFFLLLSAHADCKIYQKDRTYYSNLLLTVRDGKVYKKDKTYYSNLLATMKDGKVYRKDKTYYSNLLATGKGCSTSELAGFVAIYAGVEQ